ncbi:sugar ABC transporter permease [Clostridium bowmanii]|uniref:carbohydrate ABC transporter permease n=1 Tax=Clostridium bowmanii TaxID=132925 RepID=UPI001C0D8F1C|nr:sugar ABC transporter permease [Clostridium bowmanii]MBU3189616.1 sugar ABC transporter permease [Clostridium bowmanii]MCA1073540.1 sugar ABC transporter permease [Clostridium bowmanii]
MKKKNVTPYLFLAPHLLIYLIFMAIPTVFGVLISFTTWNIMDSPKFVGLDNYKEILINSSSTFYTQFHNGFKNTLFFVLISVPFMIIIPLLLAVALNEKPKGHKLFQALFYLPTLLSISSVILTWTFLFNKNLGAINNIFKLDIVWAGVLPYTWIAILIITIWWGIGGNMVIYLSGLASVSKDQYEAASIDGASSMKKIWYITLPGIKNQLAFTLVLTTIAQFNIYGQPLMFSNGGPSGKTTVLLMYIRQIAFGTGQPIAGIASAMAVMLGLCIIAVSLIQFRFMRNAD